MHVQLDRLAVGYNGKALIRDMEIGVRRGEIVVLVGPNGAGKSTILKTITRQLTPVEGEVLLAEGLPRAERHFPAEGRFFADLREDMKNLREYTSEELARQMAVVLTGRLQTELMTCRDVAAMGRYPYTGRLGLLSETDEQKVEEALAAVHALHLAERPFDAVSDGERQRILLARAVCQEPEIIVLDEPTSYLDIRHKLELLGILRRMSREQGITVLMSMHEIDMAMRIADRVICVGSRNRETKEETAGRSETSTVSSEILVFGSPEEVLDEAMIRALYGLTPETGSFDPLTGSVELPAHAGGSAKSEKPAREKADYQEKAENHISDKVPEVLVLSSGGTGIPVYRRLQREGISFVAGILYTNDIDWRTARLLAAEVIEERPFEEISDRAFTRAMQCVRDCRTVVDAGLTIGTGNRRMREILETAERMGKLVHDVCVTSST